MSAASFIGATLGTIVVTAYLSHEHEQEVNKYKEQITVLERQLKESKQHADTKFNLCMNRMVKR